jgi:hypothetical protein
MEIPQSPQSQGRGKSISSGGAVPGGTTTRLGEFLGRRMVELPSRHDRRGRSSFSRCTSALSIAIAFRRGGEETDRGKEHVMPCMMMSLSCSRHGRLRCCDMLGLRDCSLARMLRLRLRTEDGEMMICRGALSLHTVLKICCPRCLRLVLSSIVAHTREFSPTTLVLTLI